jgi:hypothetical protein
MEPAEARATPERFAESHDAGRMGWSASRRARRESGVGGAAGLDGRGAREVVALSSVCEGYGH